MRCVVIPSLAAAGLSVGLTAAASAADLGPVPAPVYTKAPIAVPYTWTGFYVGGNVGYGWGKSDDDISVFQSLAGPSVIAPPFATLGATDPNKVRGIIGGGQVGYNWQVTNFLLGLEADIQGSGQKHTNTLGGVLIVPISPLSDTPVSISDTSKLDWFGTVRGRLGFIPSDRWLVYATGGLAYGEINESGNAQPANLAPTQNVSNAPFVWNQSTTKVGWTVGAGVENAFAGNWSWKVEYLYVDLGNVTANVSGGLGTGPSVSGAPINCYGPPQCVGAFTGAFGTVTSRFTDNIVRVGVNYRFN